MIQRAYTRAFRSGSVRSECRLEGGRPRAPQKITVLMPRNVIPARGDARPPSAVLFLIWLLFGVPITSWGIAEWHGQPGEYLAVENGLAPNRRLAIVAHEDNTGKFGLFLQNRETQRPVAEVAIVLEPLDTAPEAFHAEWAPDSRHVAIWHRIDTKLNQLVLYRVDAQRAYSITGESLLRVLSPELGAIENRVDRGFQSLKWLSSTRFLLHADGVIPKASARITRLLGRFGQVVAGKPDSVRFSINGECELASDDRYRVLGVTPGKL